MSPEDASERAALARIKGLADNSRAIKSTLDRALLDRNEAIVSHLVYYGTPALKLTAESSGLSVSALRKLMTKHGYAVEGDDFRRT